MISSPHILFVDDEDHILKALRRHFRDEPYDIHTAASGPEALAMLKAAPMEVVVSDFRMPGMDGGEFLKRVSEQWPETVRLVLSGYADITALISAINEGAIFKFGAKPWREDELKNVVREAVAKHRDLSMMRLLAEQTLLDNAALFSQEAVESETIRKRNIVLEARVEMLKVYQHAFEGAPMPLLLFDDKGRLIGANAPAAARLHRTELTVAVLPEQLRMMLGDILSGTASPFVTHKVTWEDEGPHRAMLTALSENQKLAGVIAYLD
jgi:two-component system, NtrC family, sensor kinase